MKIPSLLFIVTLLLFAACRKARLLFILLLCPLLSACRKDSNHDDPPVLDYEQHYVVIYDDDLQETQVTAMFCVPGGRSVILIGEVTCNGQRVHYSEVPRTKPTHSNNTLDYQYKWTFGGHVNLGFVFRKQNGVTFTNHIDTSEVQDIGLLPGIDTIFLNSTTTLPFTGGALAAGESVSVTFSQGTTSTIQPVVTDTPGATTITIPPGVLSSFTNGGGAATIRRSISKPLAEPDRPGGERIISRKSTHGVVFVN